MFDGFQINDGLELLLEEITKRLVNRRTLKHATRRDFTRLLQQEVRLIHTICLISAFDQSVAELAASAVDFENPGRPLVGQMRF